MPERHQPLRKVKLASQGPVITNNIGDADSDDETIMSGIPDDIIDESNDVLDDQSSQATMDINDREVPQKWKLSDTENSQTPQAKGTICVVGILVTPWK